MYLIKNVLQAFRIKPLFVFILLFGPPSYSMEAQKETRIATFAAACVYCSEKGFEKIPGVIEATAGFVFSDEELKSEKTVQGISALKVEYDPKQVSYDVLLHKFWRSVDPTDPNGQFSCRSRICSAIIFYHNEQQRKQAEASKQRIIRSGRFSKPIIVRIIPVQNFFTLVEFEQNVYRKMPLEYIKHRESTGKDQWLYQKWFTRPSPLVDH